MIHDLVQGSPEWEAFRLEHHGASEAAAMLGLSPYMTRSELLKMKKLGMPREFAQFVQERVLDRGHETEALARPHVERILGQDLYPSTHSMGRLSASCDGLTLDDSIAMEHKQISEDLFAAVQAGQVPEHHMPQCQQVLMVTGASELLFVVSDGTPERLAYVRVLPDEAWFQRLRDGWAQFEKDLAAYELLAAAPAAPVGKTPETLPALRIEVTGAVTASNLAEFKRTALATIRSVNRELRTDQDFADAEKAVKWCGDVESRLKAAKEHALSQTADIDALFKALDDIGAEARTVRLDLEKLTARRKTEVKEEAVAKAREAMALHVEVINAELSPYRIQAAPADFAGAIKGLRSFASMQDALDTALAAAKIAADAQARDVRKNVEHFKEVTDIGTAMLFPDIGVLVHKAPDDFRMLVQARVIQRQEADRKAEEARQAAEAQRIAAAEQRAREQEAARIAERQRQEEAARVAAEREAESKRIQAENDAAAALRTSLVPAAAGQPTCCEKGEPGKVCPECAETSRAYSSAMAPVRTPHADEPATLKLGDICGRLGVTVTREFLADTLHIKPAKTEKAARLYTEGQFQTICRQLIAHVGAMAELHTAEVAA